MNEELLNRYADLIVGFGANVQPDQVVAVEAAIEAAPLVRRITRRAYDRGARYVDVVYFDALVKKIRIESAPEESLEWVPPWLGRRMLDLGDLDAARIVLSPFIPPGFLEGTDPARAGRDRLPTVQELFRVVEDRSVAWTISPFPTERWARLVFPQLAPEDAVEALWRDVEHVCRRTQEFQYGGRVAIGHVTKAASLLRPACGMVLRSLIARFKMARSTRFDRQAPTGGAARK